METPTSTRDWSATTPGRASRAASTATARDAERDATRRRRARRRRRRARPTTAARRRRRRDADADATPADDSPELLPRERTRSSRRRWETIQTGFVDEPRQTVEQADELVAEVMKRLAEGFAAERERLEGQWGRGEDVSTEDLRVTLQRYRGFFQRLLSA